MTDTKLFALKKDTKEALKQKLGLPKKNVALGYIIIEDQDTKKSLLDAIAHLDAHFICIWQGSEGSSKNVVCVESIDEADLTGCDFFLSDDSIDSLSSFIQKWVTPVVSKNCNIGSLLTQFNPVKSEWNAFLYTDVNIWNLFGSVVRYLENYRFVYDNKALVGNVVKI